MPNRTHTGQKMPLLLAMEPLAAAASAPRRCFIKSACKKAKIEKFGIQVAETDPATPTRDERV